MVASSPTVLKRYVALELRRLREAAGYKPEQVAERLGCARTHITHLEIMRNLPRAPELEVMLDFYGRPERTQAFRELVAAARAGKDWFTPFKGTAPAWFDLYLAMERSAVQIETYDAMIVPGLLQTHTYAHAVIRAQEPELPDEEVARRIELRMRRQDVLTRQPHPPLIWSVLDESVLLRPAGDQHVMAEQLEQLLKTAELPNVTIQVLPLAAGLHAGINGTTAVMTFDPDELEGDPGVAYTEPRTRGVYHEDPSEILTYRTTMRRIQVTAQSPPDALATLARRIKELM